jgi:CDP-diacylglycerol--serine O-phosphatidyltransferase
MERVRRRRERTRKGISLLPSLLTLGNLVCGFGAIIRVSLIEFEGQRLTADGQASLFYAGCLIFLAMIFDALDGRVARLTKSTSDFGGELDSLCDAITFGVTPGIMVVLLNPISRFPNGFWGQAAWVFGVAYACGAVLRLARFNVENTHDDAAHDSFEGLPTPAAAGVIASFALLYSFLSGPRVGWLNVFGEETPELVATWVLYILPLVALGLGYLMISRHRYVHIVNVYFRGRKSFDHLNSFLVIGALLALFIVYLPEIFAVMAFGGFALSGPLRSFIHRKASKNKTEQGGSPKAATAPLGPEQTNQAAHSDEDVENVESSSNHEAENSIN